MSANAACQLKWVDHIDDEMFEVFIIDKSVDGVYFLDKLFKSKMLEFQ